MPSSAAMMQTSQLSQGAELSLLSLDPWYWAYSQQIKLVTSRFLLKGHEFQYRPMSIRPPVKIIRKSTQGTFTEGEVLNTLHGMIFGYYRAGVYYLFPSKDKVSEFSKSRFKPLISDNPDSIGKYVRDTDSATLKRIGSGFLYFRSGRLSQDIGGRGDMKSSAALKGDPADHAVMDEFDEMDPKIIEFIDGRLAKSPVNTKTFLANPTLPDYGTDLLFQDSSQEYWHTKCFACGRYTCLDLEEYWDEKTRECKVLKRRKDGTAYRACIHCGAEIYPRKGMWVAHRKHETDKIGFTIGHPSYSWINVTTLLNQWEHPNTDIANFIRIKLGRAYVEAENRLSIQQVLDCCGTHGMASGSEKSTTMGIDQGGGTKDLFHIVICEGLSASTGKKAKMLYAGVEKGWHELDRYMKRYNVSRCVIDGLPNQKDARAFAKRFPGKVYLSYFSEHQKGAFKFDEEKYEVSSYRTEAMDTSHDEIANQELILPRETDTVKLYAKHCHSTAKKLVEDEKTGEKRYIYIPKLGGPDHYRLAQCYETMARVGKPRRLLPDM